MCDSFNLSNLIWRKVRKKNVQDVIEKKPFSDGLLSNLKVEIDCQVSALKEL